MSNTVYTADRGSARKAAGPETGALSIRESISLREYDRRLQEYHRICEHYMRPVARYVVGRPWLNMVEGQVVESGVDYSEAEQKIIDQCREMCAIARRSCGLDNVEVRCGSCDDTGDLIRADGEYLGPCTCRARATGETP